MTLQRVPVEWLHATWPQVEEYLVDALHYAKGDFTLDQVKVYLAQGQWHLLVVTDADAISGATTVEFQNRPNARVAFVTLVGGKEVATPELAEQLKVYARSMGATVLEAAARESAARLWARLGLVEKYRIIGVPL